MVSKEAVKLIISNCQQINESHFLLELQKDGELSSIKAGQFVSILVDDADIFLRRPFSIHDIDEEKQTISLFIKAVGKGSRALQQKQKGDIVDIMYPLGNGYSLNNAGKVLLIGGGFGVAPLYLLAKQLQKKVEEIHILVGARSKEHVLLTEKFAGIAHIHITTEDHSLGEKGYVTDHSIMNEHFDHIYTCGPTPMTRAIANYAMNRNIPCEVSLENMMACSFGVCLCCVTETINNENVTTCLQGPVFNVNQLKW